MQAVHLSGSHCSVLHLTLSRALHSFNTKPVGATSAWSQQSRGEFRRPERTVLYTQLNTMAEMFGSAVVQELVNRGISYVLGKREEKASQGNLMERLEMAASELESALERAQELRIMHLSLLSRRKIIKSAYAEAMELLDKHKQQAVPPGQQEEIPQGVKKRKRWAICADKNMSIAPFAGLSTDAVRRFERCADFAGRFVRDLETGSSLHHYTFCNPIVRHLLEGKTLSYRLEQRNLRRDFCIWPTYSDERGVEALLGYVYEDSTVVEKSFNLVLFLRLSESTDIVGVAIKSLQLLASGFKLVAECAMGELSSLYNLKDIAHLYGPPWVGIQEAHVNYTQMVRPNPACCKGSRHGLCANNNTVSSSELADIFPEQVILLYFQCYISVSALEYSTRRSSDDEGGRSKSRGWKPPLLLTARFMPHLAIGMRFIFAPETIGDVVERRDASSIQQTAEMVKSHAINCFLRQPDLTRYRMDWSSKHGAASFQVKKPKTKRRYSTRGSTTRRSSKR